MYKCYVVSLYVESKRNKKKEKNPQHLSSLQRTDVITSSEGWGTKWVKEVKGHKLTVIKQASPGDIM